MASGPDRRDPKVRFFEKVAIPDGGDGCWLWQAAIGADGYGRFYPGDGAPSGVMVKAHRFSYETRFGTIPVGLDLVDNAVQRGRRKLRSALAAESL